MNEVSVVVLIAALACLILLSAIFSSSETAMMAVNRYRIKSLAENGNRSAKLVLRLLDSPDKLLGTILFGNNVANIAASTLATVIGLRLFGDAGLAYAPMILVFVVLIFAEVAPKTMAAIRPEAIAFPAAYFLAGLQIVLAPCVWLVKVLSNGFLGLFGVKVVAQTSALSTEELRAAVSESGGSLNSSHQEMLLRILEMENIKVEEVMIPRSEMEAIDLNEDWEDVVEQLATSHHTRVPVYEGALDNFIGVVHIRKLFYLSQMSEFNRETLLEMIPPPHFIPENTSITMALQSLQGKTRRFGTVVDEYGSIKGLVTLEQILEEIVGKFTNMLPGVEEDIQSDGADGLLVQGSASLRELNKALGWKAPTTSAKTLNGLILETLENIPSPGTSLKINDHVIEILQTRDTAVQSARIRQKSNG